jgi:mono/diheme cytochrome c family protein
MQMPTRRLGGCLLALLVLTATGCAIELQNPQPRQAYEASLHPPGSVATGWRVFQQKCAGCHGTDATGGEGPDLVLRLGEIGQRRFVNLVLRRYDWVMPGAPGARDESGFEALVDDIVAGRRGAVTMPAWQGEPQVQAHILDLYAYLSARADGRLGPGRPAR